MTSAADQEKPDTPSPVQTVQEGPWPVDPNLDSVQLLSRALGGTLLLGSDALVQRLRFLQREILTNPDLLWRYGGPERDGLLEAFQDLAWGLYMRGQRTVSRGVRGGIGRSLDTAGWAASKVDRWTDNRLTRPFRRRLRSRTEALARRVKRLQVEGNLERRNARLLAASTVNLLIAEIIEHIAEDPALSELIRDQMSHQSRGLANVVADTARDAAVTTDDFSEGLVRKLLRLSPREELPPSPHEGMPQDMYSGLARAQDGKGNDD